MRKILASSALGLMLVTGGATAVSAQTATTTPAASTTEKKEDNSGKLGLLGLAGLAKKKHDDRPVGGTLVACPGTTYGRTRWKSPNSCQR